jgi:redox-sensitive bicupin YhaK (pirin superfamily)
MGRTVLHAADTRGHADHGWLNTYHSFSFASYHDPERIHFGALRVLNDDYVKGGFGFGKHPHDNMEIITIILKGALEHQDSMGHTQAIHPNEVQVMSAGTGILHSEYNHNKDEAVNLLQIWIIPNKRGVEPRYDQRLFDADKRNNIWQLLVSPIGSVDDSLKIHQDAWISRLSLDKDAELPYKLHAEQNGAYIFITEGAATVNDTKLSRRDGLGISGVSDLKFIAEEKSDILLLEIPMYA